MGITKDERKRLHEKLDALLDRRGHIERFQNGGSIESGSATDSNSENWECKVPQHDLFLSFAAFMAQGLGEDCLQTVVSRSPHLQGKKERIKLAVVLACLGPLFKPESDNFGRPRTLLEVVSEALHALDAGETHPIFESEPNQQGERYTGARHQLMALCWIEYLIAHGDTRPGARQKVSAAYGRQWDTMRKWHEQCERHLGEIEVQLALEGAGSLDAHSLALLVLGPGSRKPGYERLEEMFERFSPETTANWYHKFGKSVPKKKSYRKN